MLVAGWLVSSILPIEIVAVAVDLLTGWAIAMSCSLRVQVTSQLWDTKYLCTEAQQGFGMDSSDHGEARCLQCFQWLGNT